ncbi:MAG: PDZ domain-containing protein [Lactobacillus sp.]|nr:PDZ domain-containing protein [Lactobacillus sp.]
MNERRRNKKRNYWIVSIIILVIFALVAMWPTKYYIEGPGQSVPVSQFVNSKQKTKRQDNLYMVTVSVTAQRASVFQYLWSFTKPYDSRISEDELLQGQTNSQYQELQNWYMETSQQNAIYYAAKRAGLKPTLKYQGVYVMGVQKNSSFKNKLQIGDTVLGANGIKFRSTDEMMSYLAKQKIGSKVKIQVLRNKTPMTYNGKIVKVAGTGKAGIGIQLVERVSVSTDPKVTIDAGDIGGPSAGLMFALQSYEIFSHKTLAKGHKIAGTGTINSVGKVGIIGGVDKKVVAANRVGAEVFFAPTDSTGVKKSETNYEVAKRTAKKINSKMKIVPVSNFNDALTYLEKNY